MLSRIDREVLTRAMQTAKAERADQLAAMLKDRPWEDVAMFAAYCCQTAALNLKPWQEPPMHAGDDRLLTPPRSWVASGLSKFEPDPIRALERASASAR